MSNYLPEWDGLSLSLDIRLKRYLVLWPHYLLPGRPLVDVDTSTLQKRIIAWYEERVKPFLAGHSLGALFSIQVSSRHDLLALADTE